MDARLSDAVFSTPAAPTLGGPGPVAPVPAEPRPRTARVRVTAEVVGVRGALGGYYRSLPPFVDDITKEFGPDTYDRMQLDDQVSSSLRVLCHGVLSDELVLRPAVDDRDDPDFAAAKDALGFCERATWGQTGGLDSWLLAMLKGALGGGNRVSETVYRPEESGRDAGRWVLGRLKVKPRRSVAFAVDSCNNLAGILGLPPGGASWGGLAWGTAFDPADPPDNFLPREKFCHLAWDPPDEDPRGSAVLRCVYEPWWAKLQAAREWLAYLAQFGSPSLVGTTASGADSTQPTDAYGNPTADPVLTPEQDMANQVLALRNGGVFILPSGATLEILQTSNAGDAFLKKVDSCDRAIAQGVLLAMRAVMQSRFGSRADAEQGQDVAGLQIRFMKRWLARMVTEDLLRNLVRINLGPDAARRLCPYASLSPVEHQDLGPALVAMTGAWKAGFLKDSQLAWAYEQFGMPPALPEELKPPAPPQAPGAPPGPGGPPPPGGPDEGGGRDPLAQALLGRGPPGADGGKPQPPPLPPGSAPFAFDESRHPRGQPENAGQFGPGGGGAAQAAPAAQAPAAPAAPQDDSPWGRRQAGREARRAAAEQAPAGAWDTSRVGATRKDLEDDPSAEKARGHALLYAELWRGQEAELRKAGATEAELGRVAKARAAGEAAAAKRLGTFAAAHAKHREAAAALARSEQGEPPEPGPGDYPPEPEEPAEPGGADPAAHARWEKEHDKWEGAHDRWEAAYAKVDEDFARDHDRWEAQADRAQEKADAAGEKAGDALEALTDALDEHDEKFQAAVDRASEAVTARLDAEEEADPEPEAPEAGFAFNPGQFRVPAGSAEGGGWGSGGGGTAVADKPPAAKKPRVDVGLTDREEAAVARIVKGPLKIKGGLTPERLAALGGAPEDGQATVRPGKDKKSLQIHVSNDFTAVRHLRRLGSGELIMENESIHVKESEQGKGLGTEAFARQVDAARALGVGSIRCHAARYDAQGREAFNGYSTWPKLGYDQDLEDLEDQGDGDLAGRARAEFPGVESILQLMAVPGGKHWWAKNGTDLHKAKFDLADGSDSMLVLGAYLDARKEDAARG